MIQIFLVLGLIASPVYSLSAGVPSSACADGMPKHFGISAQTSSAPYEILYVNNDDESVTITIKGATEEDVIKGFLFQAKSDGSNAGHFLLSPGDNFSKIIDCGQERMVSFETFNAVL